MQRVSLNQQTRNYTFDIQFIIRNGETSITSTEGNGDKDVVVGTVIGCEVKNAFDMGNGSQYVGNTISLVFPHQNGKSSAQFLEFMELASEERVEMLLKGDTSPFIHLNFSSIKPSVATGVNPKDNGESVSLILQESHIDWEAATLSAGFQFFDMVDLTLGKALTRERSMIAFQRTRESGQGTGTALIKQVRADSQANAVLPVLESTTNRTKKTKAKQ